MALTGPQKITLKAYIDSVPALASQPLVGEGPSNVAAVLNLDASPVFWVWRTFVPDAEIYEVTTEDATSWSWTSFIGRSQGERDAWRQMVNMKGGINAALANVRAGISDIFSGAGGSAQRTHLLTIGRRKARQVEKVLATGTGSTASPATMGYEGPITPDEVADARNNG